MVNDHYWNYISALVFIEVLPRNYSPSVPSGPQTLQSWMTTTFLISDSTDEYLDWNVNRGNSDWMFYKDLARVGSHFLHLIPS